jgi:hypothetical protein
MNDIQLSDDRMRMTISGPDGQMANLRSARPGGFNDEDLENAKTFQLKTTLIQGQIDRTYLYPFAGKKFLLQINTGPPTWWLPRLGIKRGGVMVGWLRGLIALSWGGS